jgi:hypothetical protein
VLKATGSIFFINSRVIISLKAFSIEQLITISSVILGIIISTLLLSVFVFESRPTAGASVAADVGRRR